MDGNELFPKNNQTVETSYELEKLYRNLGKEYYEGGFEDPLPQLLGYFDKITKLRNELGIGQHPVTGHIFCTQCGSEVEEGALFCGKCGYKVGGNG